MNGVINIPLLEQALDVKRGAAGVHNTDATPAHFVAGPENRLVEVAVRSVLENTEHFYSPIVFHGASGTGKTHLALGLANAFQQRNRDKSVIYTTASDFARRRVDAIETASVEQFRKKHRRASLLVVDDLERLSDKEPAQIELLHTLDAVERLGGWIIITCKLAPGQLPMITTRLQDRLFTGLCVSLKPPSLDARLALLEQLAESEHITLSPHAAQMLAEGVAATARELRGAVLQLKLMSQINATPIDRSAVKAYLTQCTNVPPPAIRDIAIATSRFFSLKLADLRSSSRRRAVVTARNVAMYLTRKMTGESFERIGEYFGGRDHTTVLHGCRQIDALIISDATIKQSVEVLNAKFAA